MRTDLKIIVVVAFAALFLAGCNDETVPDKHTADLMKQQRDARMSRQPSAAGTPPGAAAAPGQTPPGQMAPGQAAPGAAGQPAPDAATK